MLRGIPHYGIIVEGEFHRNNFRSDKYENNCVLCSPRRYKKKLDFKIHFHYQILNYHTSSKHFISLSISEYFFMNTGVNVAAKSIFISAEF